MLTMEEILNIVPAWTRIAADTQLMKDPVYIDCVTMSANKDDQTHLYDGVGTTGKKFTLYSGKDTGSECFDVGLVFNDGLYIEVPASINVLIVKYRPLPG